LSRNSVAWRGCGTRPANAMMASFAAGPLTRTTAIAAGGRPDDSAKIVSRRLYIADFLFALNPSSADIPIGRFCQSADFGIRRNP